MRTLYAREGWTKKQVLNHYRSRAMLFAMSGRWPVSRYARGQGRPGYDGCPEVPEMPPQDLDSDPVMLMKTLGYLEKRGWTLQRCGNPVMLRPVQAAEMATPLPFDPARVPVWKPR